MTESLLSRKPWPKQDSTIGRVMLPLRSWLSDSDTVPQQSSRRNLGLVDLITQMD